MIKTGIMEGKIMDKREDLRTIKSKRLIKSTFLLLMRDRGYQHITVTDIAERALINRKTFYFHYDNIDALYEELTDDYLSLIDFSTLFSNLQIELTHSNFMAMAITMLNKIREENEPFKILMGDSTNNRFNEKLKHFLSILLIDILKLSEYSAAKGIPLVLVQNIYSDIFFEIIKWWINQTDVSSERAVELMVSMFSDNMLDTMGISLIP